MYHQMDMWVYVETRKKTAKFSELCGLEPGSLVIKKDRLR